MAQKTTDEILESAANALVAKAAKSGGGAVHLLEGVGEKMKAVRHAAQLWEEDVRLRFGLPSDHVFKHDAPDGVPVSVIIEANMNTALGSFTAIEDGERIKSAHTFGRLMMALSDARTIAESIEA